jgi:hypothetical protein
LKYLFGLPNTKKAPETRLLANAHQTHGMTRSVISLSFCDGTAKPNTRRLSMTTVPIRTAMPKMWIVWIIGGKPGMVLNDQRAPSCKKEPDSSVPMLVKNSGIIFFFIASQILSA